MRSSQAQAQAKSGDSSVEERIEETPTGSDFRVTVIRLTREAQRKRDLGEAKLDIFELPRRRGGH